MPKWADYIIHRVRFDRSTATIDRLEIAPGDDPNGPRKTWTRQEAMRALASGKTIVTAVASSSTPFILTKGQAIYTKDFGGRCFIKSEPSRSHRDGLDELPRF